MARRRRNRPQVNLLGILAISLILIGIIVAVTHVNAALLLLALTASGVFLARKLLRPGRLRRSALAKAGAVIEQHVEPLMRRRAQLVRSDAYGKLQLDKWAKEMDYFVANHIAPALTPDEMSALLARRVSITRMVAERIEAKKRPLFPEFSNNLTPADFEMFCAEQLRLSGWDARVTLQSRDQGVDVIAEKAGVRVVLQCKLYSGPVGNKAVQEVVAARAHEQAHYGAVVTNSRYTSPAEQLASTNAVLLLHYTDVPNLAKLIADSLSTRARLG
jgi:restriction system protein